MPAEHEQYGPGPLPAQRQLQTDEVAAGRAVSWGATCASTGVSEPGTKQPPPEAA